MIEEAKGHLRHIAAVARETRRDIRLGNSSAIDKALAEIENSARHALLILPVPKGVQS